MWNVIDYQETAGWYRPKSSGGGGFAITALTPLTAVTSASPSGTINGSGFNALVIGVMWNISASTTPTITGMSVNSVNATQLSGAFQQSVTQTSDIWYIPSGANGAFSITFSAAPANGTFVQAWGINTTTTTPTHGDGSETAFNSTITSGTFSVPAGGGVVAFGSNSNDGTGQFLSFTGATFTTDNQTNWLGNGSGDSSATSAHSTTASGSISVTATDIAANNGQMVMSVAAIAP